MYTLDTNAILYYVSGDVSVRAVIDRALAESTPLYTSAVTIVELLRFQKLSAEEERGIRQFVSLCSVVNIDILIADSAASIGRMYNLKLADSVIAATVLYTGSTLLTRNTKDFRRVPSLVLQKI